MPDPDKTPVPTIRLNGNARWWGAVLLTLFTGGGGALAILRGGEDPRVTAAEAKVEEMKTAEMTDIKGRLGKIEGKQDRQGRLLSRIAEKLRVKDDETEDDR